MALDISRYRYTEKEEKLEMAVVAFGKGVLGVLLARLVVLARWVPQSKRNRSHSIDHEIRREQSSSPETLRGSTGSDGAKNRISHSDN